MYDVVAALEPIGAEEPHCVLHQGACLARGPVPVPRHHRRRARRVHRGARARHAGGRACPPRPGAAGALIPAPRQTAGVRLPRPGSRCCSAPSSAPGWRGHRRSPRRSAGRRTRARTTRWCSGCSGWRSSCRPWCWRFRPATSPTVTTGVWWRCSAAMAATVVAARARARRGERRRTAVWPLYVLALCRRRRAGLLGPAFNPLLAASVPARGPARVISLSSVTWQAASIVGPALGRQPADRERPGAVPGRHGRRRLIGAVLVGSVPARRSARRTSSPRAGPRRGAT